MSERAMTAREWFKCRRKLRHVSRKAAMQALWHTGTRRTQRGLVVYQCEFCNGGWHIGHQKRNTKLIQRSEV